MHELNSAVSALLRDVAGRAVMPRFRQLVASEISEKSPGELVTIADRDAEALLAAGLHAIDAEARIVGEEAASDNPELLTGLDAGRVWIIDPVDGTANYAAGRAPFGMIIALACDGVTEAAWLYDPLAGRICHAALGGGAFVNGQRFAARPAKGGTRPVAALATQFLGPDVRDRVTAHAASTFDLVPIPRCAAEHYPRVAFGENDIALFQRTLPWDHAAGALFLTEAGGRAARWDGCEYRFGDGRSGLLIATSAELWDRAAAVLCCPASGLPAL